MKITKDMKLQEVISKFPKTVEVFSKYGLHCFGCFAAAFENIEQGAKAHGIDVDKLIEDLNKAIKKK
jgi:hybrid cluster-associated redox disulfide protein